MSALRFVSSFLLSFLPSFSLSVFLVQRSPPCHCHCPEPEQVARPRRAVSMMGWIWLALAVSDEEGRGEECETAEFLAPPTHRREEERRGHFGPQQASCSSFTARSLARLSAPPLALFPRSPNPTYPRGTEGGEERQVTLIARCGVGQPERTEEKGDSFLPSFVSYMGRGGRRRAHSPSRPSPHQVNIRPRAAPLLSRRPL